jgi:hypothetical protein
MGPFLRGFADELIKVAAFPQHEADDQYDSGTSIDAVMNQVSGPGAREGLKQGRPVLTPPAGKKRAPTPLTTPNNMVGYTSEQG